jgi:hypothetical protein
MIRIPAALVVLMTAIAPAQKTVPAVPLAARIALPDGYASEQDTESDGAYNFAQAPGVRGHILRRFVQSGDDKTAPRDLIDFFANAIRRQRGVVLIEGSNNVTGRIDGRIPGTKPLWLHVEVSDEGGVVDVLLLEEQKPAARIITIILATIR